MKKCFITLGPDVIARTLIVTTGSFNAYHCTKQIESRELSC